MAFAHTVVLYSNFVESHTDPAALSVHGGLAAAGTTATIQVDLFPLPLLFFSPLFLPAAKPSGHRTVRVVVVVVVVVVVGGGTTLRS